LQASKCGNRYYPDVVDKKTGEVIKEHDGTREEVIAK
jgi:hypothetical protein